MVIGVKSGTPAAVAQNEVFDILRRRNHPIIDIGSEQEKLWEHLEPFMTTDSLAVAQSTSAQYRPQTRPELVKFEMTIKEFEHVLRRYPVSHGELEDFITVLREKWTSTKDSNGA